MFLELLCCDSDGCKNSFHLDCLGLTEVPYLDTWTCPICMKDDNDYIDSESVSSCESEEYAMEMTQITGVYYQKPDIRLRYISVCKKSIQMHRYSSSDWKIIQPILRRHVLTIQSCILHDFTSVNWRKELRPVSSEIARNLSRIVEQYHNYILEIRERENIWVGSIHNSISTLFDLPKMGGYIRDLFISDTWINSVESDWSTIENLLVNVNFSKNLDARILAWCQNCRNREDNKFVVTAIANLLQSLSNPKTSKNTCITGVLAIAIMKRLSLWDKFLLKIHAKIRVKKCGVYCNGESKIYYVNDESLIRSKTAARCGGIVFILFKYQLTKFLHLEHIKDMLLMQNEVTLKTEWQIHGTQLVKWDYLRSWRFRIGERIRRVSTLRRAIQKTE